MKVILSRKGFDSTAGGFPSPIFPDGSLLSLLIPTITEDIAGYSYSKIFTTISGSKQTYLDVLRSISKSTEFDGQSCHLDPDLKKETLPNRSLHWRPIFGQSEGAQSHLANNRVGVGDLFLFYGWFQGEDKLDLHIVFGYLQVGQKIDIKPGGEEPQDWMRYHPHAFPDGWEVKESKRNCLYVARDKLTFVDNLPGAGTFKKINNNLILTEENETRSVWKDLGFRRTGYRQEYVSIDDEAAEKWAKKLIEENRSNILV